MLRKFIIAIAVTFIALGSATAQNYPTKPIRFIVPFGPGGNTDIQARLIGRKLTSAMGQQVIVDNRPGAGGTIGVEMAAKAPPDGYTIVLASFGNILVGPSLYKKLPYDPAKDLDPVILLSEPAGLIVVHPSVPVNSFKELIDYAKANPGKLNYASSGNGTWNHLFAEQLKAIAGIRINHVPYKGAGPAMNDVVGGHVPVMFAPFPSARTHLTNGRLRALAVTGTKRSPLFPDVPTVAQAGLPAYSAASWFGILAPAGTPKAVIARLNREVNRAFAAPDIKAAYAAEGLEPAGGTPGDMAKSIREGMAKWGKLVRDLGLKL
ncbi:MAG: tripartite tricarboxylate transporter substrate binding protein [Betaproteobacteria bacterium]|nr:tripartite tricarboxylate transporter substrate binding protein [Betaproteobacteria bacterium]